MKLQQILEQVKTQFKVIANKDLLAKTDVVNLAIDSRLIKDGDVFFALKGLKNDGVQFIFSSAKLGAKAVIVNSQSLFEIKNFQQQFPKVIVIASDDNFALLVEFLKIFYHPLPKNIYGITGTNGKTSCVEYIRQILNILNIKSASIGTLGVNCDQQIKDQLASSSLTTPDIVALYRNLYTLKKSAIDDVAIEVSSIGLDQQRVAGLKINCTGFTNFSQDHLDYHLNMENYLQCKLKLFSEIVDNSGVAVINADIEEFNKIKAICENRKIKIIDYGNKAKVLKLIDINLQDVKFEFNGKAYQFKKAINGDFQAYNLLCALGCVIANHNLKENELKKLLENFLQIQVALGRMQKIAELVNNAEIFIDFAHSPDALKNVLLQAKKIQQKKNNDNLHQSRIIVLFGCGGDRDRQKRPIMGEIACQLADLVIVTDDNPRTENSKDIRQEILAGCNQDKVIEIADRFTAINQAVKMLEANDILILAGKGHEKYQIIGDKKIAFDEEQIVKNALK